MSWRKWDSLVGKHPTLVWAPCNQMNGQASFMCTRSHSRQSDQSEAEPGVVLYTGTHTAFYGGVCPDFDPAIYKVAGQAAGKALLLSVHCGSLHRQSLGSPG